MAEIEILERPLNERLRPGAGLHEELVSRLNARQNLSERRIQGRYDAWNQVDEHCRLYIDLSRQAKRADRTTDQTKKEMPFQRAVVMPMSVAILQVRLVELMGIFLAKEPAIQLEGSGPEDVRPGKVMTAVLDYDLRQMGFVLQLYSMLQDAEKYGLGAIYDTWDQQPGWIYKKLAPNLNPLVRAILKSRGVPDVEREWGIVREHNRWETLDPFNFWPDPRVPLSRIQESEFVGHRTWRSFLWLLERSEENGGPYFNLDELEKVGPDISEKHLRARDRATMTAYSMAKSSDDKDKGFYCVDHMQVKLIPREWKLSEETRPEIWWFSWGNRTTIIRAHSGSYEHNNFTYSAIESNPDPHVDFNPGTIENLDGLQRVTNWLFNSHIENSRRHLNNSMIYGSTWIEEEDLLNRDAAGNMRLTAAGEALVESGRTTMDQLVHQMQLTDVTRSHMADGNLMMDMAMRYAGTADQQMAQTARANRTLGEIERVLSSSSKRMAIVARFMDDMALRPLVERAVSNRQQFTEIEQYFRITGELMGELGQDAKQLLVRPNDLAGNFDYISSTGALPPDPARQAEIWVRMLEGIAQIAPLGIPGFLIPGQDGKVLDVREIFNEAARNGGAKNIERFYKQIAAPQVLPDQEVDQGVQDGNIVPIAEAA